jgi:trans-2,3-dihydro-3-hydroxyanthranilate isomerase
MRRYRFLQLDVFTARPFGGNQLAVLSAAEGLSDAEMQAITREMNYAETTFVLPAEDPQALCRVRIFTPATELPMAGHPTVGTTFALAHEGRIQREPRIHLQLGVGTLPIDLEYTADGLSFVWMHQPVPTYASWDGDRAALATALGLREEDLDSSLPIERGSSGVPYLYVPLRSLEALARARISADGGDLLAAIGEQGGHAAAYLFTLERPSAESQARARMFAPYLGVVEDAATGSAAGPFGGYLVRHGRAMSDASGEARMALEQGIEMGRPSHIAVDVATQGGAISDVRVGGQAVLIAEGELRLP